VGEVDVKCPELDMARQLVESLVGDFDPDEYENEYRNDLRAMLEAKLDGQEIVAPEPPKEAPVVDLMEALKQSVAQARKDKPAAAKPKAAAKKAPAKKRAAAR
jgi:DNA end-binding protein Ku